MALSGVLEPLQRGGGLNCEASADTPRLVCIILANLQSHLHSQPDMAA